MSRKVSRLNPYKLLWADKDQNDLPLGNESTTGRSTHRRDRKGNLYQHKVKALGKPSKVEGKCKSELGKTEK